MQYRRLGKTGMEVSAIGLGSAQVASSETEHAVQIIHRALELGVNYFDTARSYWDSEIILGEALRGHRENVYVSSKTEEKTRDGAWQQVHESLERLQTDYLDNCHLHGLRQGEDLETRLGPGGALEALVEAKEQGLIRHIGCTAHLSRALVKALERFDFEIILIPMNIVERDPLDELIPLCVERDVGVTIMKPVATGLLPAGLALKWLLNQPIACPVPGCTTIEEIEENAAIGALEDVSLSPDEERQVQEWAGRLEHVRCRICGACEPCPVGIPIGETLGSDVMYDHYRTMGAEAFAAFPWRPGRVKEDAERRKQTVHQIEACTECEICQVRCPADLPVIEMLRAALPGMTDMLRIWETRGLSA
ncbi:MAG: aldo/keto reductase [Chloroflexi bacterium]|nr:aldo/keto reductase [Chloroflexota bacterium]